MATDDRRTGTASERGGLVPRCRTDNRDLRRALRAHPRAFLLYLALEDRAVPVGNLRGRLQLTQAMRAQLQEELDLSPWALARELATLRAAGALEDTRPASRGRPPVLRCCHYPEPLQPARPKALSSRRKGPQKGPQNPQTFQTPQRPESAPPAGVPARSTAAGKITLPFGSSVKEPLSHTEEPLTESIPRAARGSRGLWPRGVDRAELRDVDLLRRRWRRGVAEGALQASERALLQLVTLAQHALRSHAAGKIADPAAAFAANAEAGRWYGSAEDEAAALALLRADREQAEQQERQQLEAEGAPIPAQALAQLTQQLAAGMRPPTQRAARSKAHEHELAQLEADAEAAAELAQKYGGPFRERARELRRRLAEAEARATAEAAA